MRESVSNLGTRERKMRLVLDFRALRSVTRGPVYLEIIDATNGHGDAPDGRRRMRADAGGVRIRDLIETGTCGFIPFFCHARVAALETPSCEPWWH